MSRGRLLTGLSLAAILFSGCAKPDWVTTIKSPVDGVFYTVETLKGQGAIDNDFKRVYAHLECNGKSKKMLVVDGTYLEFSRITWTGSHDVTLCMRNGFTDSFRNQVTLIAGDKSETIHNHLRENCNTP